MKSLWYMVWQEKKAVILAMSAGTISGITAVALFAQSGFLISKAALIPPFYIILILTAFLKLFGVAKSISKYIERLISHDITFRLMSKVRMNYFKTLVQQKAMFQSYQSGELLSRITNDVDTLQNFFLRVLYPPFVALFVFLATILFSLLFSWHIAGLLMIGFVFTTVIVPYYFSKVRKFQRKTVLQKEKLTSQTTEFFYGYRDLQLHNQLSEHINALFKVSSTYSTIVKKETNQLHFIQFWNQFIALLTAFFVVTIGAYIVTTGVLDGIFLAMLVLVALTVFEVAIPIANVPSFWRSTEEATSRLSEIQNGSQDEKKQLLNHKEPISFHNVSVSYANSTKFSLKNISFEIKPHEKIAIVGPSGSGKSTLLQLFLNEMEPTSGETTVQNVSQEDLYKNMAVQLQQSHFFTGTLLENLQIANEHVSKEEIQQVLNLMNIQKSVDTQVLQKGSNLSGGEKQRLALSRVLLKNSPIWLLDEPFSNIDPKTEHTLMDILLDYGKEKTILLVSHRLSNLHRFDRVFVMLDGQIVEQGKMDELVAQKGVLNKMLAR